MPKLSYGAVIATLWLTGEDGEPILVALAGRVHSVHRLLLGHGDEAGQLELRSCSTAELAPLWVRK